MLNNNLFMLKEEPHPKAMGQLKQRASQTPDLQDKLNYSLRICSGKLLSPPPTLRTKRYHLSTARKYLPNLHLSQSPKPLNRCNADKLNKVHLKKLSRDVKIPILQCVNLCARQIKHKATPVCEGNHPRCITQTTQLII